MASSMDGLYSKIFRYEENHIVQNMHQIIINIWYEDAAVKDYRDGVLIPLYKEKGAKVLCTHFRGFTLLSSAGKTILGIVLLRLNT